jgi:hypothetical protein
MDEFVPYRSEPGMEDFHKVRIGDTLNRRRMKKIGRHQFQESSVSWDIAKMLEEKGLDYEFSQQEIDGIAAQYQPTSDQVKALIDWVRHIIREGRTPTTIH